jgi:hypothetical protein
LEGEIKLMFRKRIEPATSKIHWHDAAISKITERSLTTPPIRDLDQHLNPNITPIQYPFPKKQRSLPALQKFYVSKKERQHFEIEKSGHAYKAIPL